MQLQIGNFEVIARKALPRPTQPLNRAGAWHTVIREPYTGAWQENMEVKPQTALANGAAFACVTLIAQDVAKCRLRLVEQDDEGNWHETSNPAYSPVLRKPNRYQTINKFVEQWITSKLIHGNSYALKERDQRGVVRALYVLDPTRVVPLVAPDGAVYYEIRRDDLSGVASSGTVTVPASEIIHDMMVTLFHPLVGVSPLFACGLSAMQGINIQTSSNNFFAKGSRPGGILTAPGEMTDEQLLRLKTQFETDFSGDNAGRLLVVSNGLTYHPLAISAEDSELIEQLRWTSETICSCYHVPAFKIGVGPHPPYGNEAMNQQYYSDCIQSLLTSFEAVLDVGLDLLGTDYGTEFDIDDLIWLDTATKTKAAADAIGSGAMAPNEARKKYFGLGSVKGGQTPYMQQQNYALSALAERDADQPFSKPQSSPQGALGPAEEPNPDEDEKSFTSFAVALYRKDWSGMADAL